MLSVFTFRSSASVNRTGNSLSDNSKANVSNKWNGRRCCNPRRRRREHHLNFPRLYHFVVVVVIVVLVVMFHFINFIKTNDTGISMPSQNLPINSTGCCLLCWCWWFSTTPTASQPLLALAVGMNLVHTTCQQLLTTPRWLHDDRQTRCDLCRRA